MTFTVLEDLAGLEVTAHYGIRYWSEFWLLDPGNPNLLEWRNLSNGSCTNLEEACSADDEKWFPEYMGCRKKTCSNGRTSTGQCRPDPPP